MNYQLIIFRKSLSGSKVSLIRAGLWIFVLAALAAAVYWGRMT